MSARLKIRVRIETTLAVISILLAVLTTISTEWIEELTGFEPKFEPTSHTLQSVMTSDPPSPSQFQPRLPRWEHSV
jgi:hypothetical protein